MPSMAPYDTALVCMSSTLQDLNSTADFHTRGWPATYARARMSVTIGALRESAPREPRVCLVPAVAETLPREAPRARTQRGPGVAAGLPAGTIRPSQLLIIGAGVAGLQAIATARRLGAVVEAYDVRSATREQVKSLGAKFVDTGVSAEGSGGYARELTAEEKARQQEVLDARIAAADAVITTASVPGRPAPKIISRAAVERMRAGSVVVDIAAEQGGNCELTRPGEVLEHQGVKIVGPVNLPAELAYNASEMYARNLYNFF